MRVLGTRIRAMPNRARFELPSLRRSDIYAVLLAMSDIIHLQHPKSVATSEAAFLTSDTLEPLYHGVHTVILDAPL
jgi:hypothetical protein